MHLPSLTPQKKIYCVGIRERGGGRWGGGGRDWAGDGRGAGLPCRPLAPEPNTGGGWPLLGQQQLGMLCILHK
jgi:hypothetical protein